MVALVPGRGRVRMALLLAALGAMMTLPPTDAAQLWASAAPMGTARAYHTATLLPNGNVLVTGGDDGAIGGGSNGPRKLATAERYDPVADRWTTVAPMPIPHTRHTAILLPDGRVFVIGDDNTIDATKAELYDPATDHWTLAAVSPAQYGTAGAALLPNGQVLVVACEPQRYDPTSDRYSSTGPYMALGACVSGSAIATLADGRVLVTGGPYRGGGYNSAAIYNPTTDQWTRAAPMHAGRAFHTATLLADGQVLVVGGMDLRGALATAERYDPVADAWTAATPLPRARSGHTATLLSDGRVLVVGGVGDKGDTTPATTAILYDPKTDQWSDAGTTDATTGGQTATRLRDGTVLVAGGNPGLNAQSHATANTERYVAAMLPAVSHRRRNLGGTATVLIAGAGIAGVCGLLGGLLIRQRRTKHR